LVEAGKVGPGFQFDLVKAPGAKKFPDVIWAISVHDIVVLRPSGTILSEFAAMASFECIGKRESLTMF
jgi:hypothetical protein